ncbi:hypothetical protein M427DRAFT_447098 [Gonapodya prolifera JEL478]|uniref:Uncharacterized protein n=1 Tax=Gonapodya prolifera (strain JEL478) TaxID=1344416 RepID=A0A139A2V9_GONPJ|nr:hypothetical protein M427DRAFT_447098 [Gonapodya prolifera JEL478]|eukprot:KXS11091.1 hypothetical protein M427DRAFT_447098 [Gonapodya prolifera JEL478]
MPETVSVSDNLRHLKPLHHPLDEFNPRDPRTSLRKFHSFLSAVDDYIALYGLENNPRAIALVSLNIPDPIRDNIRPTDGSTRTIPAWKKSLEVAYFPLEPHIWHRTLAKLEWDPNASRLSSHVTEFIRLARCADIVDSTKPEVREQLSTRNLWYHFLDSLPQHVWSLHTVEEDLVYSCQDLPSCGFP